MRTRRRPQDIHIWMMSQPERVCSSVLTAFWRDYRAMCNCFPQPVTIAVNKDDGDLEALKRRISEQQETTKDQVLELEREWNEVDKQNLERDGVPPDENELVELETIQ